jgi:hypothetical protein
MNLLKLRRTSGLFFKTTLVVITLLYSCFILCSYKSNFHKSLSFKYRGLEVNEIQNAPTTRLFIYPIPGFDSSSIEVITATNHVLRTKDYLLKAVSVVLYSCNAFYVFTTINAP